MAYMTATITAQLHTGHAAYITANTSDITDAIAFYSGELNTFLKVDSDICSFPTTVGSATTEELICGKAIADVVTRHCTYQENIGNIAPQLRADYIPSHLYLDIFAHLRESLRREKTEEHPKAYNYNLRTGQIRKWT